MRNINSQSAEIFGKIPVVEMFRREFGKEFTDWTGDERTVDIFTDLLPGGVYTVARMRVLLLLPNGAGGVRIPPFLNMCGATTELVMWTSLVGLLRPLWAQTSKPTTAETKEWMYVISQDLEMAAALNFMLEAKPSIVLFPMGTLEESSDLAKKLTEHVRTAATMLGLNWNQLYKMADNLLPVFAAPEGGSEVAEAPIAEDVAGEVPEEAVPAVPVPRPKPHARQPYWEHGHSYSSYAREPENNI